jgi:hypothetical protein
MPNSDIRALIRAAVAPFIGVLFDATENQTNEIYRAVLGIRGVASVAVHANVGGTAHVIVKLVDDGEFVTVELGFDIKSRIHAAITPIGRFDDTKDLVDAVERAVLAVDGVASVAVHTSADGSAYAVIELADGEILTVEVADARDDGDRINALTEQVAELQGEIDELRGRLSCAEVDIVWLRGQMLARAA